MCSCDRRFVNIYVHKTKGRFADFKRLRTPVNWSLTVSA